MVQYLFNTLLSLHWRGRWSVWHNLNFPRRNIFLVIVAIIGLQDQVALQLS